MTPCRVTVKKPFTWNGTKVTEGKWIEVWVGSNMPTERFNELLDVGAITLGIDEKYLAQKGKEDGIKNLADRKSSNNGGEENVG